MPPDVRDDLGEIVPGHARNLRHVAELPVMGAHSHFCGEVKGRVCVVIGLVDLVEKRRSLRGAACPDAMTDRAVGVEQRFPFGKRGGHFWARCIGGSGRCTGPKSAPRACQRGSAVQHQLLCLSWHRGTRHHARTAFSRQGLRAQSPRRHGLLPRRRNGSARPSLEVRRHADDSGRDPGRSHPDHRVHPVASKTGRHLLAARRVRARDRVPPPSAFTPKERTVIREHRTPQQVQRFLDSLPYNWEKPKATLRSFRGVITTGTAHCLEAAITSAAILEQHGYPPLMLSLEPAAKPDPVLYLFKQNGRWGTIARSREAGLHGRKPVFRSLRDLVLTYVEPYVDFTGRLTGYGVGTLSDLGDYDWRFSRKNVWKVEEYLLKMPHKKYHMSKRRYGQ